MEEQQIKDIFHFVDSVLQNKSDAEHRSIQSTLDLAEGVAKVIEENKHLVPYHLNLIDELHINENGHSRILYKLLEYRDPEGRYNFLESLLKYIAKDCEKFGEISVTKPEITQELCRIDLWVCDKASGYAIIFENKVYNATDQEAQLSRYIKCTRGKGFTAEQIFVVYLPQSNDKDPSENSWGEYKEAFASRYVKFSFRNGVLPWLKSNVLPKIHDKDKILKSAIEQYVDYLEGLFKQRESDKQLYIMVENYIKEKLGLNDDPFVNKKKLERKIEELDEVRQYLVNMIDTCKKQLIENIIDKFPKCSLIPNKDRFVIKIPVRAASIYVEIYKKEYGFSTYSNEPRNEFILNEIKPILEKLAIPVVDNNNSCWYGYKKDCDWDDAYSQIVEFIKELKV